MGVLWGDLVLRLQCSVHVTALSILVKVKVEFSFSIGKFSRRLELIGVEAVKPPLSTRTRLLIH